MTALSSLSPYMRQTDRYIYVPVRRCASPGHTVLYMVIGFLPLCGHVEAISPCSAAMLAGHSHGLQTISFDASINCLSAKIEESWLSKVYAYVHDMYRSLRSP